jgi:TP901 family phage tail tape measure protein
VELSEFLLIVEGNSQGSIDALARTNAALEATELKTREANAKLEQQAQLHNARMAEYQSASAQRAEQSSVGFQARQQRLDEEHHARLQRIEEGGHAKRQSGWAQFWFGAESQSVTGWGKLQSHAEKGLAKLDAAAKKATAALGIGLVAFAGFGFEAAATFDAAAVRIHTDAGAFDEDLEKIKTQVMDLAPKVRQGPQALIDALYHLESVGLRGATAMDALKASADLASIGHAKLEDTVNAVAAVISTLPEYAGKAGDAVAILNGIVGTGNMRMDDLTAAIGTGVLPAAANFGLTLLDVGAAMATLTDEGMPAEQTATRLRMTFAMLGQQSGAAAKALEAIGLSASEANEALSHRQMLSDYGIHVTDLASDLRKPQGLLVALKDIKSHLEKAGLSAEEQAAVISKAFGGGRTSGAILGLMQQMDKFGGKYDLITAQSKRFADDLAQTHETAASKQQEAIDKLEVAAIKMGTAVTPAFLKLAEAIGFVSEHLEVLIPLLAVLAARLIIVNMALLANPIGAVIIGLTLLGIAIYEVVTHFEEIKKWVTENWAKIALLLAPILLPIAAIIAIVGLLITHFEDLKAAATRMADWLVTSWHQVTHAVTESAGLVEQFFKDLPGRILGILADAGHWLYDIGRRIIEGLWDGLKSKWEDLKGWLGGLGGWITSLKGPEAKDRRLLIPHGNAIMDGLHEGLLSGWGRVANSLSGMTAGIGGPKLSPTVAAYAGRASIGGAAPGSASGGTHIGDVSLIVNNPTQNVDIGMAFEQALWRQRMKTRGFARPARWPLRLVP